MYAVNWGTKVGQGGGGGHIDYAILPSPSVGSHYYAGYKEQRKSHSPT